MTCARSQKVDFSTVYYDAKQRVLVPSNSPAQSIGDLVGKRVCATAGSTPVYVMEHMSLPPDIFPAPQAIDCLVYMQQGRIAGISTDSSILLGFETQDPNTKIVGPPIADVPYGMEISKTHRDFVRFVNGVLANSQERRHVAAALHALARRHHPRGPTPAPPPAEYDG